MRAPSHTSSRRTQCNAPRVKPEQTLTHGTHTSLQMSHTNFVNFCHSRHSSGQVDLSEFESEIRKQPHNNLSKTGLPKFLQTSLGEHLHEFPHSKKPNYDPSPHWSAPPPTPLHPPRAHLSQPAPPVLSRQSMHSPVRWSHTSARLLQRHGWQFGKPQKPR